MSFILIGFGKKTFKDVGESGPAHRCQWCSKVVSYRLVRVLTWFSYFLIPVVPYRREYRVECPNCHNAMRVTGEELKAARGANLRHVVNAASGQEKEIESCEAGVGGGCWCAPLWPRTFTPSILTE